MESAQTADHALRVLIELERQDNQSIVELAEHLSLSRRVVLRILVTLHGHILVLKSEEGRYSLGPGLIALARNLPHELATVARPFLRELSEQVKETVVLAVQDGDEAVVVARRSGSDLPLRVEYELGFRHPLVNGANGLAILAFQPRDKGVEAVCSDALDVLAGIREKGYALVAGDIREHMISLGVPILDGRRTVLGSLAIVAPDARADQLTESVPVLVSIAERLGRAYEQEYVRGAFGPISHAVNV